MLTSPQRMHISTIVRTVVIALCSATDMPVPGMERMWACAVLVNSDNDSLSLATVEHHFARRTFLAERYDKSVASNPARDLLKVVCTAVTWSIAHVCGN